MYSTKIIWGTFLNFWFLSWGLSNLWLSGTDGPAPTVSRDTSRARHLNTCRETVMARWRSDILMCDGCDVVVTSCWLTSYWVLRIFCYFIIYLFVYQILQNGHSTCHAISDMRTLLFFVILQKPSSFFYCKIIIYFLFSFSIIRVTLVFDQKNDIIKNTSNSQLIFIFYYLSVGKINNSTQHNKVKSKPTIVFDDQTHFIPQQVEENQDLIILFQ